MKYLIISMMIIGMSIKLSSQSAQIYMPNIINTDLNERDFALSPNGEEIMFTRSTIDNKYRVIVSMKKENGEWGKPEIASFSGQFNDLEPFFSPQGNRLFFASNRTEDQSGQKKDYDIWYVDKNEDSWSEPIRLDTFVNTTGNEFYPAVASNGNLYFTGERSDSKGTEDIYLSQYVNGKYELPISISDEINTKTYEYNAYVSPDEKLIIFGSYGRADDMGGGDLYYSIKNEIGEWQEAIHFDSLINSNALDYCPFYDAQKNDLYFTSNKKEEPGRFDSLKQLQEYANGFLNGAGNIYKIKWEAVYNKD